MVPVLFTVTLEAAKTANIHRRSKAFLQSIQLSRLMPSLRQAKSVFWLA